MKSISTPISVSASNNILVVDDELVICQMIEQMLSMKGYAVTTANGYDKAADLLSRRDFDVLITDILFEDNQEDGITLLEKSSELQPDTPVIIMTGVPSVNTATMAIRHNAYEYFSKPLSLEKLADSVVRAGEYKQLRIDKKRIEKENQQYRKKLEALVASRTADMQKSKERYQLLFETSKDAIYMVAQDGAIQAFNNEALQMFAYTESELNQLKYQQLYADTDQCRYFQKVIEEQGFVKNFESRMRKKSGEEIDCLLTAHVLHDADGSILGMQGIIRDITEKKRTEEKIRIQNKFLVNIIESFAHPFMVIDSTSYEIKIANSTAKRLKFRKGITCHELNHENRAPCSLSGQRCAVREVAKTRRPVTMHHVHRDDGGNDVEHEVHAFPLFDKNENVAQVIQYYSDVTEKNRLESIAEAANLMENLGYIFSGLRHEIGNPINSVKMALSVLSMNLDHYPRPKIREFVDRAQGEISRVEYLLKALRSFSMFESPQVEPTSMSMFMCNFIALVEQDFSEKGIEIQWRIEKDDIFALTDHRAFHQVMLNLLTNAADALDDCQSPQIRIDIKLSGQDLVLVKVSDNGRGMSSVDRRNLFRPFYTSKPHGTGLGLVIIKKMLAKMNSSIRIESKAGWGTTVLMFLPEGQGQK